MSLLKIRAALETKLNTISPAIATAWENVKYTPQPNIPYQLVFLKAIPENPNFGIKTRYNGLLYVRLMYPQSSGVNAITTRAEATLTAFRRGTTAIRDGVECVVYETPEFNTEGNDGDRFAGLITIKFHTNLI